MKAILLSIPPEHLITALIVLFLCLLIPVVLFWSQISAWFKKKPKEERRHYLLQRIITYRGQSIHINVMEYKNGEIGQHTGEPQFRVSWACGDTGCYSIISSDSMMRTVKDFADQAKQHVDRVLATPDHLAQVKDMLDKMEL